MHEPSTYRAIVRESKVADHKQLEALIEAAKQLEEPYYRALTLFSLSGNPKLDIRSAVDIAEEALGTVDEVEQNWRRAELLGALAKKLYSWRDSKVSLERDRFRDEILAAIISMPNGKGLSDAIKHCTSRLGCNHFIPLLNKALLNKGFATDDTKIVLRQWTKQCEGDKPSLNEIRDSILKLEEPKQRSRLLGYLYIQCKKSNKFHNILDILQSAVESARSTKEIERLDALQYIAKLTTTEEELKKVANALDSLEVQDERIKLMGTIGGSADKAGLKEIAVKWFKEGIEESKRLNEPDQRANAMYKLASGLNRCGETELAQQTYKEALDNCEENERLKERIIKSMEEHGTESLRPDSLDNQKIHAKPNLDISEEKPVQSTNHILALYDTYEGGLKPVHFRAIARTAPLCFAFGLDLALIGFPTNDLDELVKLVVTETNIGKGGKYLKQLVTQGRIVLVPATLRKPPTNWDKLGLPVATTSHPQINKKVDVKDVIKYSKTQHRLNRVCIIMGLGRSGLPKSLLNQVQYHLEVTGNNIPLETCTAMGVIAQQLRAEVEED